MDALENKYDNFKKCYENLGKAISMQEQLQYIATNDVDAKNLFSAGVIKHFELTYETA